MKQLFQKCFLSFLLLILPVSSAFSAPSPDGIQVYHKNLHLSEEHKKKLAADINHYLNAGDMWDELRRSFVLPHYENYPQVQEQIRWFMNHQDFLINSAQRAAPYLYFISQQVRQRNLPAEVILLPMIESGFNPFAYSSMGAAGLWQMMPRTASGFGIKQSWWYEGRRDIVASTRAALDYITYLGNFFEGNWLLAIAAYDTGEGNVLSAIRRNSREGKSTSFWSLPVAQETRTYVPRLLALATIISHPRQYPIQWPSVPNAPYLAQIDIGGQIDLKHAANLAGLNLKKLMHLNPAHKQPTTSPDGPFKLVLPIEHVQQFTENLAHSPLRQRVNWIRYKTKRNDTWASVAKRFNTSVTVLRKSNPKLAKNLKPGKNLVIPKATQAISETILAAEKKSAKNFIFKKESDSNMISTALEDFRGQYTLQPGDTLYMIRKGDTLQKIANRFRTTPKTLAAINRLQNRALTPGEQIMIPTHLAAKNAKQSYRLSAEENSFEM